MKKILLIMPLILLMSCSSNQKGNDTDRKIAANENASINPETSLGFITYKVKNKKYYGNGTRPGTRIKQRKYHTTKRAVRGYFRESKEKDGSYNFLFLEFHNFLKIGPKYFLSSKEWANWVNEKIGYLNQINSRAVLYKALPTKDPKKFELQYIVSKNGKLIIEKRKDPSYLHLVKDAHEDAALEGATITKAAGGEGGEVFFPYSTASKLSYGQQYFWARLIYEAKENFSSTWENDFIDGNYLASYENDPDVVLNLHGGKNADFFKGKFVKKKDFTNPKSASVVGKYTVTEPEEGIFVFSANKESAHSGKEHVDQRIGLFVDIFDASETELKQHVVELILLNPKDSKDFLMYYEDPDNGEEGK